jgi:hypothetical protein
VLCCLFTPVHAACLQFQCSICRLWKAARHKHGSKCSDCHNLQHRQPLAASAAAPASAAPSPLPPLSAHDEHAHGRLSTEQRWAIVVLHKEGRDDAAIAQRIPCDVRSVRHWLAHYEQHHDVADEPRAGRPRCTDEATDTAIAGSAYVETFCTPRGLKRKYGFEPSTRTIVSTHLKESAELHFEQDPPELWRLPQDNDPKHKSTLVQTWLFNHGISVLDFPAHSPDLNPIENLWSDMARRVEEKPAATLEALQDVIAEEWEHTSLAYLRKLVRSMPKRCQALTDAKGDHTKY